jgi:hypothetical protein
MENQQKKYVIKDLYSNPNGHMFINEDTKSLEELWHTIWPENRKVDEEYKIRAFVDLKETKRYLKEVKRQSKQDWDKNGWVLKTRGYTKPQWDIYDFQPINELQKTN